MHSFHSLFSSSALKLLVLVSFGYLTGCASVPTYTYYELDSNPPGADIYRGTSPDNLQFYQSTPFKVNSPSSLSWSYKYFQARKKGYKDSEITQQSVFLLGSPTKIFFNLESAGGADELARFQQMNSIDGYYEFLQQYPGSPVRQDAYAGIVLLAEQSDSSSDEYTRLVDQYPDALSALPDDVRLKYVGPPGMKVTNIQQLLKQGIGEAIIEQKILSAEKPYAEFNFDEIKKLTEWGLGDTVIAAMLKVTSQNKNRAEKGIVSSEISRVNSSARTQQKRTMQGYVAQGTATAEGDGLGDKAVDCAAFLAKKKACDQMGTFGSMICMKAIPAGHNCF